MILPSPRAVYRGLRKMLRFLARPARRAGSRGGPVIQTYRGYGSRDEVFLMGRVFRQPGLGLKLGEGPLDDLVNIARRTARWGIRDARVAVTVGDARASVTTDRDGYFSVQLPIEEPLPDGAFWQQARLELLPASDKGDAPSGERSVAATAEIYIPPVSYTHLTLPTICSV